MTYRERLILYKEGKLSPEEEAKLEQEIERQDAIGEYLYEEAELDIPDEEKSAEETERTEGENFSAMVDRSIRRAFIKLGVIVGAVVLAVSLSVIFLVPDVVDLFYYDPEEVVGIDKESDNVTTSRLSLDLSVYTELFVPRSFRNYASAVSRGYGIYDVMIPQVVGTGDNVYRAVSGQIIRGKLMLYDPNLLSTPVDNAFLFPEGVEGNNKFIDVDGEPIGPAGKLEEAKVALNNLNEGENYMAYVSLKDITDYGEFYQWINGKELDYVDLWCVVYTEGEHGQLIDNNMGFQFRQGGLCINWDREKYPHLSLLDSDFLQGNPLDDEKIMAEHFTSMLAYLHDHPDIMKLMGKEETDYSRQRYLDMIDYVEKNGLQLYGFAITAEKDEIIKLMEDPKVSYIYTTGR